jgi:hypothetical protein
MADREVLSINAAFSLALGQDAQHEARLLGAVLVDKAFGWNPTARVWPGKG